MMAGGHLEVLWQSGHLSAWFKAVADFLLGWKPFHYDAEIYISIGAAPRSHFFGTHHVRVQLGGDLHLWGPSFRSRQDSLLCRFRHHSFGGGKPKAEPISWSRFVESFLPKSKSDPLDNIIAVAVRGGLVRTMTEVACG